MRAMILAGYRPPDGDVHFALKEEPNPEGSPPGQDTYLKIDHSIRTLQRLGFEVVTVLAGYEADSILRKSKILPQVELVFDTNTDENSLMTNIRASLAITDDPCLIHPIEAPLPLPEKSVQLVNACYQVGLRTRFHGLTTASLGSLPSLDLFPCIITRSGNRFIKENDNIFDLENDRFTWFSTTDSVKEGQEVNDAG